MKSVFPGCVACRPRPALQSRRSACDWSVVLCPVVPSKDDFHTAQTQVCRRRPHNLCADTTRSARSHQRRARHPQVGLRVPSRRPGKPPPHGRPWAALNKTATEHAKLRPRAAVWYPQRGRRDGTTQPIPETCPPGEGALKKRDYQARQDHHSRETIRHEPTRRTTSRTHDHHPTRDSPAERGTRPPKRGTHRAGGVDSPFQKCRLAVLEVSTHRAESVDSPGLELLREPGEHDHGRVVVERGPASPGAPSTDVASSAGRIVDVPRPKEQTRRRSALPAAGEGTG